MRHGSAKVKISFVEEVYLLRNFCGRVNMVTSPWRLPIKYNAVLEIIPKGTSSSLERQKNGFYSHSTVCVSIGINVLHWEGLSDLSVKTRSLLIFMVNILFTYCLGEVTYFSPIVWMKSPIVHLLFG